MAEIEITDEQIDAILAAADPAYLSAQRDYKPAWRSRMRKALAAALPVIGAAAIRVLPTGGENG